MPKTAQQMSLSQKQNWNPGLPDPKALALKHCSLHVLYMYSFPIIVFAFLKDVIGCRVENMNWEMVVVNIRDGETNKR